MSLFERFAETKEEGLREEFIKPLLIQLGFFGISNKHGSQEFGKDYVFSEFDPFGQFRHLAVQAKHLETIPQGATLDNLVSQIEQCFYVEYTLPSAPTETRRVSAVYVFNTGEITPNAETQLRARLKKEFVANVRCFGGSHLEILASSTAQQQDRNIRQRLQGLAFQLKVLSDVWGSIATRLVDNWTLTEWDVRGPLLHAIEEMLSNPILPERISMNDVVSIWQHARIIDALVQRNTFRELPVPDALFLKDKSTLSRLCYDATKLATKLIDTINTVLAELPPPVI